MYALFGAFHAAFGVLSIFAFCPCRGPSWGDCRAGMTGGHTIYSATRDGAVCNIQTVLPLTAARFRQPVASLSCSLFLECVSVSVQQPSSWRIIHLPLQLHTCHSTLRLYPWLQLCCALTMSRQAAISTDRCHICMIVMPSHLQQETGRVC